ncbi:hypothetical protein [Pseudomonas putida]|uniref:hypothetical protein n=1 Tax=Pseudomonas putida TaxID=303 RepID=UPI001198B676|nr:hypothetical protein [Pseudomonas putida]QDY37579.1 hypothetical protein CHR26_15465 [Pseudomonas putida]
MQPHQQILALGIVWLATLVVLPFLFATARRRAHALGVMEGQEFKDATHKHHIRTLEKELTDKQAELDAARKNFISAMDARREIITELEARIMSYTGLAVTKADYQALISASETLETTGRTWKQLKGAEAWVTRTEHQGRSLRELARRVRNELREPAAPTADDGVAA